MLVTTICPPETTGSGKAETQFDDDNTSVRSSANPVAFVDQERMMFRLWVAARSGGGITGAGGVEAVEVNLM